MGEFSMNEKNDLCGCKILFDDRRLIEVVECIGSGSSANAYVCNIWLKEKTNDKLISRALLKEFFPKNLPAGELIRDEKNKYIIKYPSTKKDTFKNLFFSYVNKTRYLRDLINGFVLEDESIKKYIVKIPEESDCIFKFDDPAGTYIGLQLFPFDSMDTSKKIQELTIVQRLEALEKLCLVVDKFHQKHILFADLKPENFLFIDDGITITLKLFDFDAILKLDEKNRYIRNQEVESKGTPFFSSLQVCKYLSPNTTTLDSDVYSIGAILYYFVCFEIFDEVFPFKTTFEDDDLTNVKEKLSSDLYNKLIKKTYDEHLSIGFWNKFVLMVNTSMHLNHKQRYNRLSPESPMKQMYKELTILKSIYQSNGIHPEVMIDNSIKKSKVYSQTEIDPQLFTNITIE